MLIPNVLDENFDTRSCKDLGIGGVTQNDDQVLQVILFEDPVELVR